MPRERYVQRGVTWWRSSSPAGLTMIARLPSALSLLITLLVLSGVPLAGSVAMAQTETTTTSTVPTTTTTTRQVTTSTTARESSDTSTPAGTEDDPTPYGLLTDQEPTPEPRVLGRQLLPDETPSAIAPPGPLQIVAGLWSDLPMWAKEIIGIPLVAVIMLGVIYVGLRVYLGVRDLLAMRQL